MSREYSFHPEALSEYTHAAEYYLREASLPVAQGFVEAVEQGLATICLSPGRWPAVDVPTIRRYLLGRFPYFIFYQWPAGDGHITIYAIMHCSREPGYWRDRLG